jgi:YVTN family beta-propeller protein
LYITYSFAYYVYYGLNAYEYSNASVFDTTTKNVTTLQLRGMPFGVTVSPDGKKVYVANQITDIERVGFTTQKKYYPIVSVVDTVTNKVIDTEKVRDAPQGVAVSPDGKKVYVTDWKDHIVSVIDTTTITVIATVPVGSSPEGIAVNPDGKKVYVANRGSNTVSVIDTATNKVTATVPVGSSPERIAFSRALKKVLPVANFTSDVTSGKAPLNVQFTDKSTGIPTHGNGLLEMERIQQSRVQSISIPKQGVTQ